MISVGKLLGPLPPRLGRLVLIVAATGFVAVLGSALLADDAPTWFGALTALGLVTVAKTVSLRIRIGSEQFMFAWGEAALVVIFGLLAPEWIAP
ncbi:MAG: hypothetical protein ACRDTM_15750, partial [Micromonosporaceae bacterium]